MPASQGLRSRPSYALFHRRAAYFVSQKGFVDAIPKIVFVPLLTMVAVAVISATAWVHDIHTSELRAEIDTAITTGSVRNN
jgi:hypothetical protein